MNRGLSQWAKVLTESGFEDQALHLSEDKQASINRLRKLNLPHFDYKSGSTSDFIANPNSFFSELNSREFYVTLIPDDQHEERPRRVCPGREAVLDYVTGFTENRDSNIKYENMILMETARMHYGANIVVDGGPGNPIYAELVKGTHSDLVGDHAPIALTMHRSIETGSLIRFVRRDVTDDLGEKVVFDHDEEIVRHAMFSALMLLPHTAVEEYHSPDYALSETLFEPGYFELGIIDSNDNSRLDVRFIDCSVDPIFIPSRTF